MDPILEEFRSRLKDIVMRPPSLPLLCNVSGGWMTDENATSAAYWADHIRQPVRFANNLATMLEDPLAILLESGPGKTLVSFARRHADMKKEHAAIASLCGAGDVPTEDGLSLRLAYGQLFLAGLNPRWFREDYAAAHPRRLSLPTYPFERRRFWSMPSAPEAPSRERGDTALIRKLMDKQENSEKWYFLPVWKRGHQLFLLTHNELSRLKRDWIIFMDDLGLSEAVTERLEASGKRVIRIMPGKVFYRQGLTFRINPANEQDYVTLFRSLRDEGVSPGDIIHAWAVTDDASLRRGLSFYTTSLPLGYGSLINLVRALAATSTEQSPVRLGVLSTHLQSISGQEALSPEKALVLGPCRVIPSEFLRIQALSIDLEAPGEAGIRPEVVDAIIRDVATIPHGRPGEHASATFCATTAYRGRHRWIQAFDRISLTPAVPERIPLRDKGVYLITGGFGGVASALSRHLARTRQARLVLTGRHPLPPREAWDSWIEAHHEDDTVSRRISQIRLLEADGAEVLPITADVADADAMRRGWEEAMRHFGRIDGIFHAASTASSSMIQAQTEEKAFSVISPKVHGTLILEELAGDSLDFIMLFSSISSHVGALGHTDYTAACLFMDTFAQLKSREYQKTRIVSVNWGYWDGIGIGVQLLPKLTELMGNDIPVQGILPAEGMRCIERILASPVEQIIVSTSDYAALVDTFLNNTKKALMDYESFSAKKHHAERPQLATPYAAPSNDVERIIRDIWQDLFGMEGIGINDTFTELGGDSLHALPMISRLEEIFRVKIPVRSLLQENTIAKLSSLLMRCEQREGQMLAIARIFIKIRDMSPEEVKTLLASRKDRQSDLQNNGGTNA